jgi:hypothetical protein
MITPVLTAGTAKSICWETPYLRLPGGEGRQGAERLERNPEGKTTKAGEARSFTNSWSQRRGDMTDVIMKRGDRQKSTMMEAQRSVVTER